MLSSNIRVSYDPLLSVGRLHPATDFGPIARIIEEEFGNDAALLLGRHADTFSILSSAILEAPKGERGLRDFLQHLRSLCGTKAVQASGYIQDFRAAARREAALRAAAEARVKALEEELARARSYLAAERVRITQVEGALAQERDLRLGLTKLAAQRGHMCERAGADLSSLAMQREEWMQDRSELTFANQRLAMGAVEYNRLNAENHRLDAELRETRRRLAESQYQLSSLNQSLNVGAAWLSGSDDMIFKARPAYQNA